MEVFDDMGDMSSFQSPRPKYAQFQEENRWITLIDSAIQGQPRAPLLKIPYQFPNSSFSASKFISKFQQLQILALASNSFNEQAFSFTVA